MQLGMIGLGRMGANMVRRLLAGRPPMRRLRHVARGGRGAGRGEGDRARPRSPTSSRSSTKPRAVWLMVPAAVVDKTHRRPPAAARAGRHPHRRRQLLLRRRHPPRQGTRSEGHPLRGRRDERRRLGPRARLLHDDRRRDRTSCSISIRSSRRWRPAAATSRARRDARQAQRHRRAGLPALRAERRRPLRQDGAQRHRVRPHGRLRRRAGHPARTPTSASRPHAIDAETTPLRDPEHYQYDFNLARHRRGLAARQRDRLVAARPDGDRAARRSRRLSKFAGRVSDSGEGRWTIKAAIDEAVPAPVLTAALYERFSSRGEADFQNKLLSAMRFQFGGHVEKAAAQVDRQTTEPSCESKSWQMSMPVAQLSGGRRSSQARPRGGAARAAASSSPSAADTRHG